MSDGDRATESKLGRERELSDEEADAVQRWLRRLVAECGDNKRAVGELLGWEKHNASQVIVSALTKRPGSLVASKLYEYVGRETVLDRARSDRAQGVRDQVRESSSELRELISETTTRAGKPRQRRH